MGIGSSLYAAYRVMTLSLWVVGSSAVGRFERGEADERSRRFARDVLTAARVDVHVTGGEGLPPDRPFVYMSNHQSLFDIPVLWSTVPARTLRFVAKTELFRTPIWGRAMRIGEMIEVDRKNRAQAIGALQSGIDLVRSGVSVWIAPEGHRSETGAVGPLKRGGFYLARDAGVDIVPLAINGTINVLPPRAIRTRHGQRVDVVIGDPIPVDGRSVDELMAEVQRFFDAHVDASPLAPR